MAEILELVKRRVDGEDEVLIDFMETISDRLCLRLGVPELPELFDRICADATVKMYRRIYYEGVASESVVNLNTSFVADILSEYDKEIEDYKDQLSNSNGSGKVLRFK